MPDLILISQNEFTYNWVEVQGNLLYAIWKTNYVMSEQRKPRSNCAVWFESSIASTVSNISVNEQKKAMITLM